MQQFNQVIIIKGVHIEGNQIIATTGRTTFHFVLPKDFGINLKHETYSIINHNEVLAKHTIKTRLDNYCPNISMKTIFMNTDNSKTNEPHKFVLNLLPTLDERSSNKHVAFQNLFIYGTWKNIRK